MSNDKNIEKYCKSIETKRKQLGSRPKVNYATNALLTVDSTGEKINLNTLGTIEQCVATAGMILSAVDLAERANEALGTNVVPTFGDHTADEWISDIEQRVRLLEWCETDKQLARMEAKLKALKSEDAKTADAIADIAGELDL